MTSQRAGAFRSKALAWEEAKKKLMSLRRDRGFSLLEMLIVVAIGFIVASMTVMGMIPVMKSNDTTTAYNYTLTTMRRARDQAAGDMRTYVLQFTAPGTITVTQSISASGTCQIPATGPVLITTVLPPDVTFHIETGVPTSNSAAPTTPDAFGTAANAIDFDQGYTPGSTTICFNPDGTATDALGNTNNGVVYLGQPGNLYSMRAITLWGSTGRLRGWRLYNNSGVNSWTQQ
jgi:prepilin-type N-terminal cleavage/methylation domain-containing protein